MPLLFKKIFSLSTLALITALLLSGIAAWYSVVGLTAIFAAAVIPIIIMGGALEFAKVITTIWLHRYWDKCKWAMKTYLTGAVIVLALVTSMGIFGFLSKAHMDQGIPTGDVAAQIQLFDDKITIQRELIASERENIEAARKTLSQMDAQLSARLDRGDSEASVERAVQIRAQQRRERNTLNAEIAAAQKRIEASNLEIQKLTIEKAPLASKYRAIEAEVGPIKYIAALIYGDNPDTATLERAVRWVIILLIFVFDPLALMLVIAAISSYKWEFEKKKEDEFVPAGTTGYLPLDDSEKEGRLTPLVPVENKSEVLPRVFGQPVKNHKANIEAAYELGKSTDTDEVAVEKINEEVTTVKKKLQSAQKALQKIQSQAKEIKEKLKARLQKSQPAVAETNQESTLNKLKHQLTWKQLTNWNNSPLLKLLNNLKKK
jgi:hypothetical protein